MLIHEHSLVFLTANPTLGPGRVELSDVPRKNAIRWLFSGAASALDQRTVVEPYPLPAGMTVRRAHEGVGGSAKGIIIRELQRREGERRKFVVQVGETEEELDEADFEPARPDRSDLLARLRSLDWDQPSHFFARRTLLQQVRRWYEDTDGLPTLTGARIRLLPHQVYAVQRVLWARSPRFVLADEVGLGKTVEAGLVIQALMASRPELSVLVIAPGSMTRQWLCEIYLRFGARAFTVLDGLGGRVADLAIVSTTTLTREPESWHKLTGRRWGMVVIDEAHQHPPGSRLYNLFRELSLNCDGILVLSATPSKRETRGILGLLALVAPEQYGLADEARLAELLAVRKDVWDRLAFHQQLREAPDFADMPPSQFVFIAEDWAPLLKGDAYAESLVERLADGDREAFDELEVYVQEHYRVDHRIIRTRRRTVQALGERWCERTHEVVEYEPSAEESLLVAYIEEKLPGVADLDDARRALCAVYLRLARSSPESCFKALTTRLDALESRGPVDEDPAWWSRLLSDPSAEEEDQVVDDILQEVAPFPGELEWIGAAVALARAWFRSGKLGARHQKAIDWIESYLRQHPNHKLLVFTEDRSVAQTFATAVGHRLGKSVDAFHSAQDEEVLKRITLEFQRNANRPVLVSDELGGEGRNFQMAEAVLHLDCPWAVSRLEQRIGRLDRVGRGCERPVTSVVFLGDGSVEREIYRIHADVFQVFQRSVGGLEFVLPELQQQLFECATRGGHALDVLHAEFAKTVGQAVRESEADFDQSLDTSKIELERAKELVDILVAADETERLAPIQYWARALGIQSNPSEGPNGEPEYRFHWDIEHLPEAVPGLTRKGKSRHDGTFDREQALHREDLHFFTPGHFLVDSLLSALETCNAGRLTVFRRELGRQFRERLFVLVLIHFDLDPQWTREIQDAGLLTRARRRLYPEVIERAFELPRRDMEEVQAVEVSALKKALEGDFKQRGLGSPQPVAPLALGTADLGQLVANIEHAVKLALQATGYERAAYAEDALEELKVDLAPEIGFLEGQSTRRGTDLEADEALHQRRWLLENLTSSRATIAGVAIIIGM